MDSHDHGGLGSGRMGRRKKKDAASNGKATDLEHGDAIPTILLRNFMLHHQSDKYTVGTSVSGLSGLYAVVMRAAGASRRVFQLLDRVSSMKISGNKCPLGDEDDINGTYSSPLIRKTGQNRCQKFQGITLKLQPGTMLALVGPSGGGKISIVSREPVLFNCSIYDNIAYGLEGKASSVDVENAAKMGNAHEFISKFPEGYQTVVGERGIRLSGAQKQRVAITTHESSSDEPKGSTVR